MAFETSRDYLRVDEALTSWSDTHDNIKLITFLDCILDKFQTRFRGREPLEEDVLFLMSHIEAEATWAFMGWFKKKGNYSENNEKVVNHLLELLNMVLRILNMRRSQLKKSGIQESTRLTPARDLCFRAMESLVLSLKMTVPTFLIVKGRSCGEFIRVTAKGGCSIMYRASHPEYGPVRIKTPMETKGPPYNSEAMREWLIHSTLCHKNILRFLGIIRLGDNEPYGAMFPEMKNGTVLEYTDKVPEVNRIGLLIGIASGLEYLHKNKVIHYDLKCDNCLVDNNEVVKICDFGLSKFRHLLEDKSYTNPFGGTCNWMSPEHVEAIRIIKLNATTQSDIWSFGSCAFELLAGLKPYLDLENPISIGDAIIKGEHPTKHSEGYALHVSPQITEKVEDLLKDCWQRNPEDRPSACEILNRLPVLRLKNNLDRIARSKEAFLVSKADAVKLKKAFGGKFLPILRRSTQVEISVKEQKDGLHYTVAGKDLQVTQITGRVKKFLQNLRNPTIYKLPMERKYHSFIIGRKGVFVHKLERKHGVTIEFVCSDPYDPKSIDAAVIQGGSGGIECASGELRSIRAALLRRNVAPDPALQIAPSQNECRDTPPTPNMSYRRIGGAGYGCILPIARYTDSQWAELVQNCSETARRVTRHRTPDNMFLIKGEEGDLDLVSQKIKEISLQYIVVGMKISAWRHSALINWTSDSSDPLVSSGAYVFYPEMPEFSACGECSNARELSEYGCKDLVKVIGAQEACRIAKSILVERVRQLEARTSKFSVGHEHHHFLIDEGIVLRLQQECGATVIFENVPERPRPPASETMPFPPEQPWEAVHMIDRTFNTSRDRIDHVTWHVQCSEPGHRSRVEAILQELLDKSRRASRIAWLIPISSAIPRTVEDTALRRISGETKTTIARIPDSDGKWRFVLMGRKTRIVEARNLLSTILGAEQPATS